MTCALVVVESMFGNTMSIGRAVADGLSPTLRVDLVEIGAAPRAVGGDVDLLVVGGPTHAFGLSRSGTRHSAVEQGAAGTAGVEAGLREWLESLDPLLGVRNTRPSPGG